MEHRDSPEIEQERAPEDRPRRRFARLVESPVSRRVALPRLIAAIGFTALTGFGVWKLVQSAARWVEHRPEHQIKFSEIELSPPPDPWVRGGTSRILDKVRKGSALGETIPLLDLDLKAFQKDFSRCAWVKEVRRIDRSKYGRLIVELVYRKPVAVIPFKKLDPYAFVIDEEAVVLPHKDIDWTSAKAPFRVRGINTPLIEIEQLPASWPLPKEGLPWKRKVEEKEPDDRDPLILLAAGLARFLQERTAALKSPSEAPDFKALYLPVVPEEPFFLLDFDKNWVCWGKAPGDEKPGELPAEARWKMLLDWVKAHGPVVAKRTKYLDLRVSPPRIAEDASIGKK